MAIISRRSFVLFAGLAAGSLAAGPVLAVPAVWSGPFSAVQTDVSALSPEIYGPQTEWVRTDLSRALAHYFPARGSRGAPRLIVRIDDLSLGEYAGAHDPGTDYLRGEAMIVAPDKTVLKTIPIKLALTPQGAGRWDLPDIDRRRVKSLCNAFAGWVARYAGEA